MPLSRLSPRSHQKGITARGKKSKRSNAQSNAPRSRHLALWDAIRLTREELENWTALSERIEQLFRDVILPREQRITDTLGRLTGSLINHFENPARDAAERSLLGLWIIQNVETLNDHPFATETQRTELLSRFSNALDENDPIGSQLIRLLQHKGGDDSQEGAFEDGSVEAKSPPKQSIETNNEESEDIVFDFGWHKKSAPIDDKHERATQEFEHSRTSSTQQDSVDNDLDFTDPAELAEKIRKSENSLSVDRLFRQLAKVLHPDREQNETLKAEKHLLMSQCLEARQKQDIDTLLQLYCEHVGDLPEDLSDTSHQELISALELQLKLLQHELRQQRFGDALRTQIVDRYSDSSTQKIEANVASHAKQLDQELRQNDKEIEKLNTKIGLELALNQRRSIEMDRMTIDEITGRY